MSFRFIALPLLTLPLISPLVLAENTSLSPLIVTATRTPQPLDSLTSNVDIITAKDIEQKQFQTLSQALRTIPGLHVVQSGVTGSQTSVFMRGSNSDHVLVLLDGIEINDPSSPSGAFDFANLLLDDVEQIEIVKGAQSVLYGSDAIGGVIQIRTKQGKGSLTTNAKFEFGTNQAHREVIGLSGSTNLISYSAQYSSFKTDGESIAAKKRLSQTNGPRDDDGYDNETLSFKLGLTPSDKFNASFGAKYSKADNEIDAFLADDLDANGESDQLFLNAMFQGNFFDDQWQSTLSLNHTHIKRKNRNDRQLTSEDFDKTDFDGKKNKLGLQNDFHFIANNLITLGFEIEKENIDSEGETRFGSTIFPDFVIKQLTRAESRTKSIYLQDQIDLFSNLHLTLGLRHDDPDQFDSETTYRASLNYQLTPDTRFTAAYGTGFKAPSLFNLAGLSPNNSGSAFFGNPDLKPETSKDWEISLASNFWQDRISTQISYFESDIEDMIVTVFLPSFDTTPVNRDEANIQGVESILKLALSERLDIDLSHTFTSAKDDNDQLLLRRPKHKASAQLNYNPLSALNLNATLLHIGSWKDIDDAGSRIDLDNYTTLNLAANYRLSSQVRLFTRIDNIGDKTYEPAFGVQGLGTTVYVGIALQHR
jgi:vitamin B12 transporter